jgi:WD40 repeat protein
MAEIKRSFAVVIGINQYLNGIPVLKTAVNDASEIARTFRKKYEYQVLRLLDDHATADKLNNLFSAFEQQKLPLPDGSFIQIQESDRFLFYFAGHGIALDALDNPDGPAGFIVPQDAKMNNDGSLLSMKRMHDALLKLPCRHLLIILDCCFAGAFRWAGQREAVRRDKVYQERYERFISSCAQQVITSAGDDEKAADSLFKFGQRSENDGHSPFADLILKALNGDADFSDDGVLTATELYVYLHSELGKINAKQTPGFSQLKRHDKGEYIFPIPGFNPQNLAKAPPLDENTNPYRGLESFDEKDSALFFGRKALIEQLQDFVTSHSLTVVLGASGLGKSSLIKAGLIPLLKKQNQGTGDSNTDTGTWGQGEKGEGGDEGDTGKQDDTVMQVHRDVGGFPLSESSNMGVSVSSEKWYVLTPIRPGESPFTALNNILANAKLPVFAKPKENFQAELQALITSIREWYNLHRQTKLLVVIDQFEELITLCQDEKERELFLQGLAKIISMFSEQIRVILTLRSDFEPQFRDTPLEPFWQEARFFVPMMSKQELRQAIVEPAALSVMYFEPPSLVENLIDEVSQMPGALPLLSFTLSELYFKYINSAREGKRNNRAITQKDYEELGGVTRSLTQRADQEYDILVKFNSAYDQTIQHVMLRMVALGGGELSRRQVLLTELEYPEAENQRVKSVIEAFANARLLVKGQDAEGNLCVEPAHDALVRGWQKLLIWKQEEQENLILQRRLTPTALEWKTKQKPEFLWHSDPYLDVLKQVLHSENNWFNKLETEFVKHSIQKKRQNAIARWSLVSGALVLLTGATIVALIQRQESILRENAAVSVHLSDSKPINGLVLAVQSTGQSLSVFHNVLSPVQSSLLSAIAIPRERNILQGHQFGVATVAISPDSKMIVSGGGDQTLRLWDSQGQLIGQPFVGHQGEVTSVAFSPDGKYIVSGSADKTIRLWNNIGKLINQPFVGHQGEVTSVAFSSDSKFIVSGSVDGTLRLWNNTGKAIGKPLQNQAYITSVAFSPDGKLIVSGNADRTLHLWDLQGKLIGKPFVGHQGAVTSVAFSPDGKLIVSGSIDQTLRLWNLTGKQIGESFRGHQDTVSSVAFSRDRQMILSGSHDNTLRLWDINGNQLGASFQGHESWVRSVAFSPNGKYIVSGSNDNTVRLWDLQDISASGTHFQESPGKNYQGEVWQTAISKDGNTIITGSYDGSVRLWDRQGKPIGKPFPNNGVIVWTVAISPDGQIIASGDDHGVVNLSDRQGNPIGQPFRGVRGAIQSVAFSPDGQIIASGSDDGTIRLSDRQGNPKGKPFISDRQAAINAIAFSPDGKTLVSGGQDQTVRLWDLKGNPIGKTFQGHQLGVHSVAFSPDGQTIVSGSEDNTLRLSDRQGNPIGETFRGHQGWVSAVAFSPDGNFIVSGSWDKTVRLWDLEGRPMGEPFRGHKNWISGITFSLDGKSIISSSADNTVRSHQGGDWHDWLQIACQQLQNHPVMLQPQTTEEKGAKYTCKKYVWNRK